MHLILRYSDGQRADALLLRSSNGVMRVVLRDRNETLEFTLNNQLWTGEDGRRVFIEAVVAVAYEGGCQTNIMYNETAEAMKTATAVMHSSAAGEMN